MSKKVILTGLRSNNDLHIGNYFGALLPIIDMANKHSDEYVVNLMLADLHSFSTPIDYTQLHTQIRQNLRTYIAAGLPLQNPDVRLFRESYIPAIPQIAHILDAFTGVGEMMRMTQYKDKSAKIGNDRVSVALLNYPPLMAADILGPNASFVPVGDDQTQHLEYTRDIAERINNRFKDTIFVVPETVKKQHELFDKDQGLRIMDLQEPTKKMSKSDESGKGVIFLSDTPDEAKKKIMSATTDDLSKIALDYDKQPGISNLLTIYKLLGGNLEEYLGQTQYGLFKTALADAVEKFLIDFQSQFNKISDEVLDKKLIESELVVQSEAEETLYRLQKAVGLR